MGTPPRKSKPDRATRPAIDDERTNNRESTTADPLYPSSLPSWEQELADIQKDDHAELPVGVQIDRVIHVLERAELHRKDRERRARLAVTDGRADELRSDENRLLGFPVHAALKGVFDSFARPIVQVAYALQIDGAALDDFIRTGDPDRVPNAIGVLRRVQGEALRIDTRAKIRNKRESAVGVPEDTAHARQPSGAGTPATSSPPPPMALPEIARTLRAMASVPRVQSVYETAGSLLINAVLQGAFDDFPEAAGVVRVHAARVGGSHYFGAWCDGLAEIRRQRGLPRVAYSECFAEDVLLIAEMVERHAKSKCQRGPRSEEAPATPPAPHSFKRPIPIARFSEQIGGGRSDYLTEKLRRAKKPVAKVGGCLSAELDDLLEFAGKHKRKMREWANKNYPAEDQQEPLE